MLKPIQAFLSHALLFISTDVHVEFRYLSRTYRHEVYVIGASLSEPHINEMPVRNQLLGRVECSQYWGEPERAPHKQDGCSLIMVRTSPARRYMYAVRDIFRRPHDLKKLLRSRVPRAFTCSLVASPSSAALVKSRSPARVLVVDPLPAMRRRGLATRLLLYILILSYF